MTYTCVSCGRTTTDNPSNAEVTGWYLVSVLGKGESMKVFCSRNHLVEHVAPELKQAVVVKQWIPTPEDEERMHQ